MRLVDADKIHKAFKELAEDAFTKEDISCFLYAESMVDALETEKAIPISWLHKALIDQMYDRKANENVLQVYYNIIDEWEKENDGQTNR